MALSCSKGQRETCWACIGVIWLVVIVVLWVAYGTSSNSCNYKVDAEILATSPHPKYAGQCLITLEYSCPRSGCEQTFTQVQQFPNYYCQVQSEDGTQQSVVGKYIQGCVHDEDLNEFHPYYDTNDDSDKHNSNDDTPGFASAHKVYSLFVAAMVITIIGFFIVAALTLWCMAAQPRSTLPFSYGSSSSSNLPTAQPLHMQPFSSPQPAQEMANTSYPPIPPHQGAPEKPNPNLRI